MCEDCIDKGTAAPVDWAARFRNIIPLPDFEPTEDLAQLSVSAPPLDFASILDFSSGSDFSSPTSDLIQTPESASAEAYSFWTEILDRFITESMVPFSDELEDIPAELIDELISSFPQEDAESEKSSSPVPDTAEVITAPAAEMETQADE